MRKTALATALTAVLLAAGCADDPRVVADTEYARSCVNAFTGERAPDEYCPYDDDDEHDGFYPMWFPVGYHVSPVGHRVSGGHRTRPPGKIIIVRVPADGGTKRVNNTMPLRPAPGTAIHPEKPVGGAAKPPAYRPPARVRTRR